MAELGDMKEVKINSDQVEACFKILLPLFKFLLLQFK